MIVLRLWLVLTVLMGFLKPVLAQDLLNPMSVDHVYSFAKDLEKKGDFNRAATEYGRLIFFLDTHSSPLFAHPEELLFRHATTLANAGETDRALKAFSKLGSDFPTSRFIAPSLIHMGHIYEKAGDFDQAKTVYLRLIALDKDPNTPLSTASYFHLAWLALYKEKDHSKAVNYLKNINNFNYSQQIQSLNQSIDSMDHWPHKDPVIAGTLSLVLPGSGHLYLDRPKDALFALLSNGLLLIGTVQAFQNNLTGVGVALGVVELGWYSGTLFSAVSLAHKYNRQSHQEGMDHLRPLLHSEPKIIGLELNLHY